MNLLRSIAFRAYGLVVFSSLLQVLLFPTAGPIGLARTWLGWCALVPFVLAVVGSGKEGSSLKPLQAAVLGYLGGFLWYLGNCGWIYQTMYLYGGLPKAVSCGILILFSLYLGLYHAMFATFLAVVRGAPRGLELSLLAVPFAWVGVELARGRITGFPWDLLGYSQIDNLLLVKLAPLGGVMLVSFVLAAVNAALVAGLTLTGRRRIWVTGAVALGACLIALVGGSGLAGARHQEAGTSRAVMMQENVAVGATGREVRPMSAEDALRLFSAETLRAAAGSSPTVVIWPEAPSHLHSEEPIFRRALGSLAREVKAPAIVGSLGVDFSDRSPRGYFEYDSASLFDAEGSYQGRYDKIHLVPWGEYVPFKQFFSFAEKLTEGVGDMDPGTTRSLFTSDGHRYGVFICYESIFGDEVREFVKNGAEVLVNISDDGWYGDTGAPWQHLNMARMRAIENHRWVLRSTNTGVTTAIDPYGRVGEEAPRHVREAFAFPFGFEQGNYLLYATW